MRATTHKNCNYAGIGEKKEKLCSVYGVAKWLRLPEYEGGKIFHTDGTEKVMEPRHYLLPKEYNVCRICRAHSLLPKRVVELVVPDLEQNIEHGVCSLWSPFS
jgi:hypothetical protein